MINQYEKEVKDDLSELINQNLKDYGSVNHMYQRKLQDPNLAYPTRFDNQDISSLTDELQMSLQNQSSLSIKLNKYRNDELSIMGLHNRRKSLNKDIPYEMKFRNQQIYGEAMSIKRKKKSQDQNRDHNEDPQVRTARNPEKKQSSRRLVQDRLLSHITDNFLDDDITERASDGDEFDRGNLSGYNTSKGDSGFKRDASRVSDWRGVSKTNDKQLRLVNQKNYIIEQWEDEDDLDVQLGEYKDRILAQDGGLASPASRRKDEQE